MIPETFKKDKYDHELVERHGNFAIYRKTKDEFVQFELMQVRVAKSECKIQGRVIRSVGDEFLPSSEDWGYYGWTLPTIEKARERMVRRAVREGIRSDQGGTNAPSDVCWVTYGGQMPSRSIRQNRYCE